MKFTVPVDGKVTTYKGFASLQNRSQVKDDRRVILAFVEGDPELWVSDGTFEAWQELLRFYADQCGPDVVTEDDMIQLTPPNSSDERVFLPCSS